MAEQIWSASVWRRRGTSAMGEVLVDAVVGCDIGDHLIDHSLDRVIAAEPLSVSARAGASLRRRRRRRGRRQRERACMLVLQPLS
jgi:hypothetical protein